MTAEIAQPQYTATFLRQSIDTVLDDSQTFGFDPHESLLLVLRELEDTPCVSLEDALAFIGIGRSIRNYCFQKFTDLDQLRHANNLCDWYTAIGVNHIDGMKTKVPRQIHAPNDTMH